MNELRRELARVSDYAGLMAALRARAEELREHPVPYLAPVPIRQLSRVTFGSTLAALGLRIEIVEDPETFERITKRIEKRRRTRADAGNDTGYSEAYKSHHSGARHRRPHTPGRKSDTGTP